jgi:DNA-directed RNA polymerase specialized sigma24 family protein
MDPFPSADSKRVLDRPAEEIRAAYQQIHRACRRAGLSPADADDVAQDIWAWLLRSGKPAELLATPWLGAVAQNYIRRYWRGRKRRQAHEARAGIEGLARRRAEGSEAIDSRLSLDGMERRLPSVEARLLHLVRLGWTFAGAIRRLQIPRGSRSCLRKRLIAHLASGLRAPDRPSRATSAAP